MANKGRVDILITPIRSIEKRRSFFTDRDYSHLREIPTKEDVLFITIDSFGVREIRTNRAELADQLKVGDRIEIRYRREEKTTGIDCMGRGFVTGCPLYGVIYGNYLISVTKIEAPLKDLAPGPEGRMETVKVS